MAKRVVLGMSVGVDSSVAVHLLQEEGYEVIGVHMRLIDTTAEASEDARLVAERFQIPFHVLDLRREFRQTIIEDFIQAYRTGLTPNPCVRCNQQIKFGHLAEFAQTLGAEFLATGHYAKIEQAPDGSAYLKRGEDASKDQSYFLCQIDRRMLARIVFPLGGMTKEETRRIADELGLKVAQKPDSQEICFVPNNDYKQFLLETLGLKRFQPGDFLDMNGQKIGRHQGIPCYTVGQRKGLGVALGYPAYVTAIDAQKGTVTIGRQEDLLHDHLSADELNWLTDLPEGQPIAVQAKIRYRAQAEPAVLTIREGEAVAAFAKPQRAITPGQVVCFYDDDRVLGGGRILKAWSADSSH